MFECRRVELYELHIAHGAAGTQYSSNPVTGRAVHIGRKSVIDTSISACCHYDGFGIDLSDLTGTDIKKSSSLDGVFRNDEVEKSVFIKKFDLFFETGIIKGMKYFKTSIILCITSAFGGCTAHLSLRYTPDGSQTPGIVQS